MRKEGVAKGETRVRRLSREGTGDLALCIEIEIGRERVIETPFSHPSGRMPGWLPEARALFGAPPGGTGCQAVISGRITGRAARTTFCDTLVSLVMNGSGNPKLTHGVPKENRNRT